uniref:Uncharacterized protein n=1 Tax=viral metagenome TaxID=1070528 RepID=A0A6M3JM55_9ZZZZ
MLLKIEVTVADVMGGFRIFAKINDGGEERTLVEGFTPREALIPNRVAEVLKTYFAPKKDEAKPPAPEILETYFKEE